MKSKSSLLPLFALIALLGFGIVAQTAIAQEAAAKDPPQLEFSFEGAEWKTVLEWVAEEADLRLIVDSLPPGKFNFSDSRTYTPTQAIDIINSWLVSRDYILVENNKQLVLLNMQNAIPANLVRDAGPDDLDRLGNYEFARCTFAPKTIPIEQVREEFQALLEDSFGKMIVLPNTGRIVVTDMVSNLRTMKRVLGDLETSTVRGGVQAAILPLENITPDEAMPVIRQIYSIPEEVFSTQDGELRFSIDPTGRQLILRAKPDKIASVKDLLKLVDVKIETEEGDVEEEVDPVFVTYDVGSSEPTVVLKIMQTMFAGQPETRLDVSEETKQLFVLATPDDHEKVKNYLSGMKSQADAIEVFPLEILDADLAKTRIEALVSESTTDEEGVETLVGPRIIADATRRQLIVRGNSQDMEMIRDFLKKMGESSEGGVTSATSQNLRVIPMDGVVTQSVLDRAMEIWPTMRANPIKIVMPDEPDDAIQTKTPSFEELKKMEEMLSPQGGSEGQNNGGANNEEPSVKVSQITVPVTYLAQVAPAETTPTDDADPAMEKMAPKDGKAPAKVVVTPGVGGVIISSDDAAALDEFEELLRLLSDPYLFPANDTVVFPLKYAKADEAKALLDQLLGNTSADSGGGGLGDLLGGGDLLGLLGDSSTVGAVTITTQPRLNTLFVQADPIDIARVEQLIKVIDKPESPVKVETRAVPRVIQLKRASATEMATTLKEAFPPQGGSGGGGGGGNGQEQIQKLLQQIGGGRGGGGGGGGQAESGPEVAIAADARSNSLIVVAPDQIYEEIEKLARYLDDTATESNEVTVVIPVTRSNPEAIQRALSSLYGTQVIGAAGSSTQSGQQGSPSQGGGSDRANAEAVKAIQQRIQQFREAAGRAGGGGGRGGGDAGGRGGGGRGGGGGGRGGGGGGRGGGGR